MLYLIIYGSYISILNKKKTQMINENNFLTLLLKSRMIPISTLLKLLNEDYNSFYIAFLEAYPDFSEKLLKINPALKFSDIEFCAYIKLNLETKQIAQFKKISTRAVEGKKYRIRKKLNIPSDTNMYIWMSRI